MTKLTSAALLMSLAGVGFTTVSSFVLSNSTYDFNLNYDISIDSLFSEGPLPSTLQEVAVPVINNTMCEVMYRNAGYIEHIPHIFICAGWKNGGFDSCEVD